MTLASTRGQTVESAATNPPAAPAAPAAPAGSAANAPSLVAPGFAPVFAGWNVWSVYQSDDPTFEVMMVGVSLDRRLRVWVENAVNDNAPGAAVSDPWNPAALRGDQIQILPNAAGLQAVSSRGSIPELSGALQLGSDGSTVTLYTVRFWNRGTPTVLPWPHDANHVLEQVFQPTAENAITSAPAPSSLAGSVANAVDTTGQILKIVAIGAGIVLAAAVAVAVLNNSRKVAA